MNMLSHGIGSQDFEPVVVDDSLAADPGDRFDLHNLRTNKHLTLKTDPLKREDLDEFVECYGAAAATRARIPTTCRSPASSRPKIVADREAAWSSFG